MTRPVVQLDLFGEVQGGIDQQRAATALAETTAEFAQSMRLDCCTGQPCERGRSHPSDLTGYAQVRCPRCGQLTFEYGMTVNHDLGWLGCPADRDAYRAAGGAGFGARLTAEQMNDRHENAHHALCDCGHARGLHGWAWLSLPESNHCGLCLCSGYAPERAA